MNKIMKKVFLFFTFILITISCASLSAQERYERGDYLGALRTTAQELASNKKVLSPEEERMVSSRINQIVEYYKNNKSNAYDDRSRAIAYLNLWKVGEIINSNPILNRYTNFSKTENGYNNISQALNLMETYVNRDVVSRVEDYANLVSEIRPYINNRSSQYYYLYEGAAKKAADKYIRIASDLEYYNKLEEARDYYLKASQIYSDFGGNYRNSRDKYNEINKKIELAKAKKYVNNAVEEYNRTNYERALEYFKAAENIYRKFGERSQISQIEVYYEAINNRLATQRFEYYYRSAAENIRKADYQSRPNDKIYFYQKAIEDLQECLKYSKDGYTYQGITREIESIKQRIERLRK